MVIAIQSVVDLCRHDTVTDRFAALRAWKRKDADCGVNLDLAGLRNLLRYIYGQSESLIRLQNYELLIEKFQGTASAVEESAHAISLGIKNRFPMEAWMIQ